MSGALQALRAQTLAWAEGFEPAARSARFWAPAVAVSSAATGALIALLAVTPALRPFFGLRPAVPLALLALRVGVYLVQWLHERASGPSLASFVTGALWMGFSFQLVASSLVVFADPPGAFMLAAIPVLGAAYQCIVVRATTRFPWPAVAHALGMALALALRPGSPQVEIFAVVAPVGCGAGLALGGIAEAALGERRLLARHRRAIEARALAERTDEAQRLSSSLLEILERCHDANSALSTVLLDAESLDGLLRRSEGLPAEEIEAAAKPLVEGLRRFASLLGGSEPGEPAGEAVPDVAPVLPAVQAALGQMARRFPAVPLRLGSMSGGAERAAVALRGGGEELERLLAELVKNACEGSGARRATAVSLAVDADAGAVSIRVADDGPGLPPHLLEGQPTPFVTTKPGGCGLGLYTADRLVAASGGSLRLENAPGGGAVVTVRLARVPEPRESGA